MKKVSQSQYQSALKSLFALATIAALLMAVGMFFSGGDAEGELFGYALFVDFLSLAIAFFGCYLIVVANDPITAINKMSVMVLWVMGCAMSAVFLTLVFTDPPAAREYPLMVVCGLPSLLMPIMAIVLYRHELQQMHKHPFDDPLAQIDALKDDEPSLIPMRLSLLLGAILLIVLVFDLWVVFTMPLPQ